MYRKASLFCVFTPYVYIQMDGLYAFQIFKFKNEKQHPPLFDCETLRINSFVACTCLLLLFYSCILGPLPLDMVSLADRSLTSRTGQTVWPFPSCQFGFRLRERKSKVRIQMNIQKTEVGFEPKK